MNGLIENEEYKQRLNEKVDITNFSLISVIGKGSYAEVLLARKKDTGTIYALKILKKNKIEQRNQKTHVKMERNILVSQPPSYLKLTLVDRNAPSFYHKDGICLPK